MRPCGLQTKLPSVHRAKSTDRDKLTANKRLPVISSQSEGLDTMTLGIVKYLYHPLISQSGSVCSRSVVVDPCPSLYHTRWRLLTLSLMLNAKQESCEFQFSRLNRPGIGPVFIVSVANAQFIQPLIACRSRQSLLESCG